MKRLVVIAGPTAVGKTAAAIEVAQAVGTEIVSCDSRQFYSEMSIGVARPTASELAAVPHHFIACRSAAEPYNAYTYEHEALALLEQLFEVHDTVVAVGGSGLYINALCLGINYLPDPAPELRARLSQRIADGDLPTMLQELQQLDPVYYEQVDRRNPIRIQRALEVILTAGCPYSELIGKPLQPRPFEVLLFALHCERDELRDRIYRRTDQMIADGLVDEVASLLPLRTLNTLNTVGYREIFDHLDGLCSLADATTAIKNHTWQYAKKQMTWLKQYDTITWLERKKISNILQVLDNK